ncbi:MAG: RluA family pseudouridine synthase [Myxococcales bacterium]
MGTDEIVATDPSLLQFEVEPNYAGWPLSQYVAEKLRRPIEPALLDRILRGKSLVHAEAVLLPDTPVWPGLRFALRKRSPGDEGEPPDIPVVYQDESLLVVDKPAGLALHPSARYHVSTLTHALATRHRNAAGQKPDPAHRLDRETSGLVACGRDPTNTRALKAAFAGRRVEKSYLALVEGAPAGDFDVDLPLAVGTPRIKVKVRVDPQGMPSLTTFLTQRRYADADGRPLALLRCIPRTGRQHQIRAHLHAAGFPLVGDKLYGPDENIFLKLAESGGAPAPRGEFDPLLTEAERRALRHVRQALHADELSFAHPSSGEPMRFSLPLPDDLSTLIAGLRPL